MTTAYLPDVGTRAANSTASGISVVDAAAEKWLLTREGFNKFLSVLDTDREASARKYELLRSKLITYFDWRDCPFPEDHADDALNRVVRKLDAGEDIRDVSTYVFGIARMMLLEIARVSKRERNAFTHVSTAAAEDFEPDENEQKIECLQECLAALPVRSRELITQYYQGEGSSKIKTRKELAARLGLQLNALRIRACRLRDKLEECMGRCLLAKGHLIPRVGTSNRIG
jgi:RNA polymerase sigma factor (sigma-70 family)